MRSGIRVGFCALIFMGALVAKGVFADEPVIADADHAVKAPEGGSGHAAADPKAKLEVTPVAEWDKDMELIPFNSKDGLRLLLAYTRTQIDVIRKDPEMRAEEKLKQIDLLEKVMKATVATFRSVNDYTSMSNGMFICPIGGELPLNFAMPKRFQSAKISVAGAPCILLALTRNYGSNRTNGFVVGIGGWVGAQISNNDKNEAGGYSSGQVEIQHSGGFIMPLNGRAPVMKMGDIQGYYLGGGVELAVDSSKTTEKNGGSGGIGAYAKIEGLHAPDVAIIMGVYGRNDQLAPHIKGEGFYFSVPWATDNSTIRTPSIPLTNISAFSKVRANGGDGSQHNPEERIKKYSGDDILKIIKESKAELAKPR